jgi:NAD(P)-dependent dehydrogenase (short-subunit alcohol dehydrogenase family)
MSSAAPERSLAGRTCLVTGATSGIGRVTALELARRGATVIVVGRDRARGEAALAEMRARSGNASVELMLADLSVQSEVRRLATDVLQRHARLDVLVNNAGALFTRRRVTADGLEATFALNHLAYFLLTALLRDALVAGAPSRVVNVSSEAHRGVRLDFDDLESERPYRGSLTYARSKLANILFTHALARRLDGTGVTANSLHPGMTHSNFAADATGPFRLVWALARPFQITPERAAATPIYLASSPAVASVTGKYFIRRRERRSSRASYDRAAEERLWQVSAELAPV